MSNRKFLEHERFRVENSVKCKHCGHSVLLTNRFERLICSYCGEWIYKNKKVEFMYRIKKELKKK